MKFKLNIISFSISLYKIFKYSINILIYIGVL